ncbi:MAG: hypothetical protein AB8G05_28225 [Oligoflexales bacterium]
MSKIKTTGAARRAEPEIPAVGSRAIEKHLSWLPLKGSIQSIFLMIAKDTRNWEDGTLKKVTMTNREIARQFHHSARTVQRCTSLLLEKGYIEKHVDRKNVAGNVITIGNEFVVPDYVFHVASLHKLTSSINNLQRAGYDASDKRAEYAKIAWHLRSIGAKQHFFTAPAKMSPPHDIGVRVNSTRAADKTRSHSCKTKPKPKTEAKTFDPPKELVSEIFKKLESISLCDRFAKALKQAPESKRSITSICSNIARLSVDGNVDQIIEQLSKSLSLIEKYECLQTPRPCLKPHSLARLLFLEELEKSLENSAAFVMDRIKKKGQTYHEYDIKRIAKMLSISPNGDEKSGKPQNLDGRDNHRTQTKMPPKPQSKPKTDVPKPVPTHRPVHKPKSIEEYDLAIQAHFQKMGQDCLDIYLTNGRAYLNDFQDFQNFYEIHCSTKELT